ncbi:DUF2716 domain-containing protein [Embleya sp. NPDC020630]|uniref:DUF2716 domain-containing protein n=1 Tax=Embleya sp. NPDC020630 TaxID=3363979 RepID=UPI003790F1F7
MRPAGSDLRFGTFGHPWEHTLCVFGTELLDTIEHDVHRILGQPRHRPHLVRQAGEPSAVTRGGRGGTDPMLPCPALEGLFRNCRGVCGNRAQALSRSAVAAQRRMCGSGWARADASVCSRSSCRDGG